MKETLFTDLNLTKPIRRAIEDMGFRCATEIQAKAIPPMQKGRDLIGRSQTGTGKTLAFGIPILEKIVTKGELADRVQALILCPTRELAAQACGEFRKLAKYTDGICTAAIYGGEPMGPQIKKLKRANIVIGTPGRVIDHIGRRTLKLDSVSVVVLDEADEMLSMGFRGDIEKILNNVPSSRQTALFSATMPDEILALTKKYQKNPLTVQVDPEAVTVTTVRQEFYEVGKGEKAAALGDLIMYKNPSRAIVFCNTKHTVDSICGELNRCSIAARAIHGDMEQSGRTEVMNGFKSGDTRILVATDVAARGIDVSDVEYVFNYDIPQDIEYYVHRIGRTGRAGKRGTAITLCEGRREAAQLMAVAKTVKTYIKPMQMPSDEEIAKRRYSANLEVMRELMMKDTPEVFLQMVKALEHDGYSADSIAAAVMCEKFSKKMRQAEPTKSEVYLRRAAARTARSGNKTASAPAKKRTRSAKQKSRPSAKRRCNRVRPMEELLAESKPAINYGGGYTRRNAGR